MALIFISYRREDSAGYAGRLHESLERRVGEGEVFRDVDALEPGQDFVEAISARLHDCRACLVLIGREWQDVKDASGLRRLEQDNDYVRLEIATALATPDVRVVPVLVEGMGMPAAETLPSSIRGLSRRHAISLRDETWDADVDRLVKAIPKASDRPPAWNATNVLKWAIVAISIAAVTLLARGFRGTVPPIGSITSAPLQTQAHAIAIPRLAEVVHGNLLYAVLSGDVVPAGDRRTLRLRVRISNEGSAPANFWDNSFRLDVRGQVLSPTSGLNELASGHSMVQGVITFEVPADATQAVLKVLDGDDAADLPLDLAASGRPSEVDTPDAGDALSRASVVAVVRDPKRLASGRTISFTLTSITARRFVNKRRIVVGLRVTNQGRYPWLFGSDAARLVVDDQTIAPTNEPVQVVAADSTESADFIFDVAPSVRRTVLRIAGESITMLPVELP